MKFCDCTKREKALIVGGGVLVVLGVVLFATRYSEWWMRVLAQVSSLLRLLVPLVAIVAGFLVIYAVATHRFDTVFARLRSVQGPLRRSSLDKRFGGVCGGIAQHFGVDSTIVRVIIVVLGVISPLFTLIAYGALMLLLPSD